MTEGEHFLFRALTEQRNAAMDGQAQAVAQVSVVMAENERLNKRVAELEAAAAMKEDLRG